MHALRSIFTRTRIYLTPINKAHNKTGPSHLALLRRLKNGCDSIGKRVLMKHAYARFSNVGKITYIYSRYIISR